MQNFFLTRFLAIIFLSLVCFAQAQAGQADAFRGKYEILSESLQVDSNGKPIPKPLFIVDTDTLEKIWIKYTQSDLPPDLVKYKDEPSIIAGFTARDLTILSLEKTALISPNFMRLQGNGDILMEIQKRADARTDLAVQENSRVSKYLLAAPTPVDPRLDSLQKEFAFDSSLER